MITLYGFGPGFGLPEISPFVTKTEVHLKMAGLAYRKEKTKPTASPKGQLPYIEDGAEAIADSTFIRAHLEGKYGFDFDAPLSLQHRAQACPFRCAVQPMLRTRQAAIAREEFWVVVDVLRHDAALLDPAAANENPATHIAGLR